MGDPEKPMTQQALAAWRQLAKERVGQDVTIRPDGLGELVAEIERLRARNQHVDTHAYGHLECCQEIFQIMQLRYGEIVPRPNCTSPEARS
jgi:FAD/FMN-containing dehydrogenase